MLPALPQAYMERLQQGSYAANTPWKEFTEDNNTLITLTCTVRGKNGLNMSVLSLHEEIRSTSEVSSKRMWLFVHCTPPRLFWFAFLTWCIGWMSFHSFSPLASRNKSNEFHSDLTVGCRRTVWNSYDITQDEVRTAANRASNVESLLTTGHWCCYEGKMFLRYKK